MKLKFIYTLFFFSLAAVLFLGSSDGRAGFAQEGNSGAPGDDSKTCQNCHNQGPIQVTLDIDLLDQNDNSVVAEGYLPGETYRVKVTLNAAAGSPNGYGFQMIALNGVEGESATPVTDWSNPASNVKISTVNSTGRTYAEQNGVQNNNEFLVDWTAPAGGGTVTFYSCGNGVNGNNATSGDGAACNTLTVEEKIVNSNQTLTTSSAEITIFPNPINDWLRLSIDTDSPSEVSLQVVNLSGRVIFNEGLKLLQGKNLFELVAEQWPEGVYFITFNGENFSGVKRFIKN